MLDLRHMNSPSGQVRASLFDFIQIAVGILMVVQCFIIKDILEDHLTVPEDYVSGLLFAKPVKLSGLKTFFLQIFYLQWVINRDIVVHSAGLPNGL